MFYLLLRHAEEVAHVFDLLEVERHVGSQDNLDHQSSKFPAGIYMYVCMYVCM